MLKWKNREKKGVIIREKKNARVFFFFSFIKIFPHKSKRIFSKTRMQCDWLYDQLQSAESKKWRTQVKAVSPTCTHIISNATPNLIRNPTCNCLKSKLILPTFTYLYFLFSSFTFSYKSIKGKFLLSKR